MNDVKKTLLKAIKLENFFKMYSTSAQAKKEAFDKFKAVWGENIANHFLGKYDNADSLIWALDSENLELFIEKF
jgi:hypothetical protein